MVIQSLKGVVLDSIPCNITLDSEALHVLRYGKRVSFLCDHRILELDGLLAPIKNIGFLGFQGRNFLELAELLLPLSIYNLLQSDYLVIFLAQHPSKIIILQL